MGTAGNDIYSMTQQKQWSKKIYNLLGFSSLLKNKDVTILFLQSAAC
jgi:hypothetical protein